MSALRSTSSWLCYAALQSSPWGDGPLGLRVWLCLAMLRQDARVESIRVASQGARQILIKWCAGPSTVSRSCGQSAGHVVDSVHFIGPRGSMWQVSWDVAPQSGEQHHVGRGLVRQVAQAAMQHSSARNPAYRYWRAWCAGCGLIGRATSACR
jgi:hypothetical protein